MKCKKENIMSGEKRKDEDIKIEAKLKEMQKYIPLLQEFLKSIKNGENDAVKQKKVKMMCEIITGKIPCTTLVTLMRIEKVVLKIKETKQRRLIQEAKTSKDSKSSKDNALEVINLDSSDDDDVEIVSYTAPEPISGTEYEKSSTCVVLTKPKKEELTSPGNLKIQKMKEEEIRTTANKVVTSDINKNNESVPDLNEEADKRKESLGMQNKKIKINLMPKESLKPVIRKTCDYVNKEPISPSVSIPNKNSSIKSTKNILKTSKNMAEVSSTTPQVPKIIEFNKSPTIAGSKFTAETIKASQKSKIKPNEAKEILNVTDFEDVSSEKENAPFSSREISPNLKKLSDFENDKKLIIEKDVSVTTTNDNQDSPRKHSNILKSIDLPKKDVENDMENIQDLNLLDKVNFYFDDESCSSEAGNNEKIVSSSSELTVFEVSEDYEKTSVEVSSSCKECDPQVNERSLQTSPISEDPLSSKMLQASKDEEENKDAETTCLLKQDIIASSQDSSVLWINDVETEEFIKNLDLEIGLENSSQKNINDKKGLTKDTSKSSKCKIPNRRLSNALSSTRCNAPRLRSEVFKPSTPKLRISSKKRTYSTSSTQRSQSKISSRRPSEVHSLDATSIKDVKLKSQVQALQLAMPITLKEGPTSPLHDRLVHAGLLTERCTSLKQTEHICCTVASTEVPQNPNESQSPIESESCAQPLSTMKDSSSEKMSNNLEDNSNEKRELLFAISPTEVKSTARISPSEKSSENNEKDNAQFPSVVLSNPEKVLENSSSPLKDSPNEEELFNGSVHIEHKETLHSEVLIKQSEHLLNDFNFVPNKTISDMRNESGLSSFSFCTKGTSNLVPVKDKQSVVEYEQNQAEISSTVSSPLITADSVGEAAEQIEKPLLEKRTETLKSDKQILDSEEWDKVLNSIDIQNILEQNKHVFQKFLVDSVNENSPDEASTKVNTQDESCPLKISPLDKWADKSLDELHEIRFQLEKKMGVDLGIILYSAQNEDSRNISITLEKTRRTSVAETSNKAHQLKLKTESDRRRNTIQSSEKDEKYNAQFPSVALSKPEKVLKNSSSPLKDSLNEEELSNGSVHIEHNIELPSGLKPNDPRLRNQLALLYRKTHDPVGQPQSSQTKYCAPTANKILRSQDQNARNGMLQTYATMTTVKNFSSPPTTSKRLQNYSEYKILKRQALEAEAAMKKDVVEAVNKNHQLEMEAEGEKQKSENERLKNLEIEGEATLKKVQREAHQVKFTPEKTMWKTLNRSHKFKPDKLKTLKVSKQRRNTIQVETEPRKSSIVKPGIRETLKVRRDGRKTIQIEVEPNSETEVARKKVPIEIANRAHQLELESERTKQETLRPAKFTAKKERRITLEKTRRTSVAETSNKAHQLKLKTEPERLKMLKIGKERRNTIQVETVLEAETAKQKSTVESATRTPQVERERRKTIQTKIETASEAKTTKNKVDVEVANKALRQKNLTIEKEKHKTKELEVKTAKKSSQNTPEEEKGSPTISNSEDIGFKIAIRKRRKPILESSSDSESEGTHYHSDGNIEEIKKARRKQKVSEAVTEKSPKISRSNIRKRRKTTNCNEIGCKINNNCASNETRKLGNENFSQLNEFQEQHVLTNNCPEIDISNLNEIKEFACRLIKPLLKEKPFEMFQNILQNSELKNNRRKSNLPTDSTISRQYKVSPRELRALNKDLDDSFIGCDVRNLIGRRRSGNYLNVLTTLKNSENSQNCESEENISEKNAPNLSDADYDTDIFEEYVSRKKMEEEINIITKNLPVVLVTKLAPEDLMKSIKPAEAGNLADTTTTPNSTVDEHLLKPLKIVQIKHHSARRKSQCAKKKSRENKNTNPLWHYKDSFFSTSCILCSRKSSQLVEHYLEYHPHDEVYISRLPPADVRDLEENPGRATRHLTKQHQYIAECFLCGQTMKGRFDKFSHHYATHTGEFPYACSECTFMSCNKSDMIKHTKFECKKDSKLKKYYTYDNNVTKINLYVCTKCNFMQLHEANIIRHLRKEHDCNEIHETDVKALTLLELVDDPQQNILIANEPVPSDPKSDEETLVEVQPGGSLVLPIMLKKEDYDTDSVISGASIDVKSETLLVDPCPDQSIAGTDMQETHSTDLRLNQISIISDISAGLKLENPELPKTTTHGDNVMNWEHKDNNSSNENGSENKNDDVEELLRILTCTPSTTPNPSDSFRTTDQHNATEDLNSLVPTNVESQKIIEESNGKDLTFDLNKSNLPIECLLQGETEINNGNNLIDSAEDHEKSSDVEIQENLIPVIEILEDEDEPKCDLLKTETMLEASSMKENENCALLRVENCGYQEIRDSEYLYRCLIEKCNFGATVLFEVLQDHVKKEHNVMWSGKCNVCKEKLAALPGKQPIEEELNHMISVHIKELHDSQSNDGNHVINLLKPWLSETKSHKMKILCEGMVSEMLLTRLYKCMGDDCSFTSDSKAEMSKHLATHELKAIGKADNQRPWLECCYCEHYADKTLQILEHVKCEHSSSIFQCSRCFYRSCSRINVKNHQNQYHPSNARNTTLQCSGNVRTITDDFKRIQKLKEDNIKAVPCSVCTQKYIRKDLMIEHFKMVHKESEVLKDLQMGLFSCIFCNFEDENFMTMCCHMANKHPGELLLIGVRGVKENSVQDDISSIASPEIAELEDIKPQPNDISSSAGFGKTEKSEINYVQKFKKNLMNLQDLKKLCKPHSTYNNSREKQDSGTNERGLTELSTKMVQSLKYFMKSEILHPCCICSKQINLENQWTDHFNTAHPTISRDAVLQCPQCPKMSSFWTYPLHFINNHIDQHKIYFCYYCASHFYNSHTADKHLMSHADKEVESKCFFFELSEEFDAGDDKINKIFIVTPATNNSSVVDVIKHMIEISKKRKEEHSKPTNFIDVTIDLKENICGVNYPAYIPKKQQYVCSSCNRIWIDEKAFENHFKTAHKALLAFQCPHCDLHISPGSYEAVRDHLRLHSQEIIYKCCVCNMYADNIESLIKHITNYKQQNVPIARFTRDDKIVKYGYNVMHFSPLSTNRSSDKKIQCSFCPTCVDTYKNLDIHLSNVHKLGRTYKCYYCTHQGDIKNVNSHIKEIHIKSDPEKFPFISTTIFLTIQNQEGNCSHLPDEKVESTNNASYSEVVVVAQDVSRKRKYSDISDRPTRNQNDEVKKRLKSQDLEGDKLGKSDPTVKDDTTANYHLCNLCAFKCTNYEDYMSHIKTHSAPRLNSVNTSESSFQDHTTTTLSVIQANPFAISSNKAPTDPSNILLEGRQEAPKDKVRLVPLTKLLETTSRNQNNVPQPSTCAVRQKRPLSAKTIVASFTYICFHCFTEFNSYNLLCKHWQFSTCPSNENKSYRFKIARRGEYFICRRVLDKIVQMAKMKSSYYECSECGSNFFNKVFCIHHMASKMLAPIYYCYEQEDILYGCDECSIFYKTEEQAIQHIAKHTFRFSCLFCSAAYRSLEELHLHCLYTHKIAEKRYKYDVRSSRNMEIYLQMLVVFPCGLVLTKDYLSHTCWGNEKAFTKLIDKYIY